jgi:hypothetical protein
VKAIIPAAGFALGLAGCATTPPDVTARYYFPKAETQLLVTETVGCSPKPAAGTQAHRIIRAVMTVAPTTTNSADMAWLVASPTVPNTQVVRQGHLRYRDFSSALSDEDITVTLTADGRLSGINATSTGEGDTIIKNLVTVAGAAALVGGHQAGPFVETPEDEACDVIDGYAAIAQGDPTKIAPTLTLTYSVAFTYDFGADLKTPTLQVDTAAFPNYGPPTTYDDQTAPRAIINMVPDPAAANIVRDLQQKLPGKFTPHVELMTTAETMRYLHTVEPPATLDTPSVELTQVAMLDVRVTGYVADLKTDPQVWNAIIPAPTRITYPLPIPKPADFGKTAFSLALSDYGSVTSLHYGSNTAGPDLSDAAGAIAKALPQAQTPEDKANTIKGQADLIAQQQRLISCEVDPTTCK